MGEYTVFPSRLTVLDALRTLPNPGAKDEGIVMLVAQAYADGDIVMTPAPTGQPQCPRCGRGPD